MVRNFTLADAHRTSTLIRNTLLVSNSGDYDLEVLRNLSQAFSPERIKALASRREIYLFERDGELLGTISLEGERIYCFFVAPDRQKEGIGTALLRYVEERARAKGVGRLHIAASLTAVRFYEARGYRIRGREHDRSFGTTVQMWKPL